MLPTFGDIMKQARIDRGWFQEDLAKRLGVTQTFVSQMERGIIPKFHLACLIIQILEIDLKQVLEIGQRQYIDYLKKIDKWPLDSFKDIIELVVYFTSPHNIILGFIRRKNVEN